MIKLELGNIVIHPLRDRRNTCLVCVVVALPRDNRKYILLQPFTKRGYVSLDSRKFIYLSPLMLPKLKIHKKYSQLKFCPDCHAGISKDYLTNDDLYLGLKKISAFSNTYKCRSCKLIYKIGDVNEN